RTKVSMAPTLSDHSLTPLGGPEVPYGNIWAHKIPKCHRVRFSSNKNQINPFFLLNKRSHGVHLIRNLETPPWCALSDFGPQDLTSASGTPRRGSQGVDQV